ncbi:hypothetical protein HID58_071557, partial [Brassica napus]
GGKIRSVVFHRTDDLLVTSSEDDSLLQDSALFLRFLLIFSNLQSIPSLFTVLGKICCLLSNSFSIKFVSFLLKNGCFEVISRKIWGYIRRSRVSRIIITQAGSEDQWRNSRASEKRGVIMEKLPSFGKAATMERQKSFRGGFLEKQKRFRVVMERQLSFIGETPLYTAAENGHSAIGTSLEATFTPDGNDMSQVPVATEVVKWSGALEWSIHGYWSGAFTSDRELLFHCLVSLTIHKVIYSILYFNLSSQAIHNNFYPSLYIFAIHLKSKIFNLLFF